ncbi:MAG: hypothetical protein L6U99_09830 [Clostridium sp.]|nr:MAG: hypothetical protein L6U99_09830 [Clostridium sp.]
MLGIEVSFRFLTYLPHFLSTVVVTSIITLWCYEGNGELEYQPGLLFQNI